MPTSHRTSQAHAPRPASHTLAPILLGCDHAGFALKETLRKELLHWGHDICDFTPRRVAGDDYPVVGNEVARAVVKLQSQTKASRPRDLVTSQRPLGILVCGSGVGVAIAANRVKGARAVEGFDAKQVKLAREHNDANILALGAWNTPATKALKLIDVFLKTEASKETRHQRRVKKLG